MYQYRAQLKRTERDFRYPPCGVFVSLQGARNVIVKRPRALSALSNQCRSFTTWTSSMYRWTRSRRFDRPLVIFAHVPQRLLENIIVANLELNV